MATFPMSILVTAPAAILSTELKRFAMCMTVYCSGTAVFPITIITHDSSAGDTDGTIRI